MQSQTLGGTWAVIEAQLKITLEQAGFKNIRIMPSSFVVQRTTVDAGTKLPAACGVCQNGANSLALAGPILECAPNGGQLRCGTDGC
jgi:hypothetical protein